MTSIIEYSRLLWQCRRGMLELDLLLLPFVKKHYPNLSDAEKESFEALLHYADPDIHAWIMGFENPTQPELIHIVNLIRHLHTPETL